ncbi:hypothetical protein [Erwinia sp. S38]|uniref:hypothetical protein n=1 Tax=Erwinia sp. S38 TaxID=2769338 RepID=UPI00190AF1F6|nr:hypothetical protein [Erwinia sp. S38]MBK0000201.1 hypothetical protein [Erwinia sp. S38]
MPGISLSNEHSTLEEVEKYYNVSNSALYDFYSISSGGREDIPAVLFGLTKDEVEKERAESLLKLERMCSLELLAVLEARIRIDYIHRVRKRLKDNLSRDFRRLHRIKEYRTSLVDELLNLRRKNTSGCEKEINELIRAIDYRNWLAHGRYWTPKKAPHIAKYDYLSVKILSIKVLSSLDLQGG